MEIYVQEVLRLLSHWNIVRGLPSAGRVNEMPLVVWRLMILGCSLRVSGSTPRSSTLTNAVDKRCVNVTWDATRLKRRLHQNKRTSTRGYQQAHQLRLLIHERDQQQNTAGGRERSNKRTADLVGRTMFIVFHGTSDPV